MYRVNLESTRATNASSSSSNNTRMDILRKAENETNSLPTGLKTQTTTELNEAQFQTELLAISAESVINVS